MRSLFVFGISGFIGKHIITKNGVDNEFNLIGMDVIPPEGHQNFTFIAGDMFDIKSTQRALVEHQPDYILNLVGKFSSSNFSDLLRYNVESSQIVLEIVRQNLLKPKKILLVGSAAEYGIPRANPILEGHPLNPINLYGLTKSMQAGVIDFYFRSYNLPVVLARTFNIVGEGISDSLSIGRFNKLLEKASEGDTLQVGNLKSKRDFLPVLEVIRHYWKLLLAGIPGEIYNVCSGKPTSMRQVLELMIRQSGKQLNFVTDQNLLKENDVPVIYGSNRKLRDLR